MGRIGGGEGSVGSGCVLDEEVDGDDDIPVGHHFTFIPPNPRKYYKRLLEHCLLADLEAMLSPSVGAFRCAQQIRALTVPRLRRMILICAAK